MGHWSATEAPAVPGSEVITGTARLHVGELADARAAAGGAPSLPTLFAAELTVHPGVDSIARDGLRSA
ncbi:hypothetical protein AB0M23_19765 [Streptomyces sp. NPDC052077]|uniref:hypothetical protein n=1 Tax=Streptomyces sp. NPDC052077 TaxID=3154757 RepID=UPI0034254D08